MKGMPINSLVEGKLNTIMCKNQYQYKVSVNERKTQYKIHDETWEYSFDFYFNPKHRACGTQPRPEWYELKEQEK